MHDFYETSITEIWENVAIPISFVVATLWKPKGKCLSGLKSVRSKSVVS
jgi:hypothetical protein